MSKLGLKALRASSSQVKQEVLNLKKEKTEDEIKTIFNKDRRNAAAYQKSLLMETAHVETMKWRLLSFKDMIEMSNGIVITDPEANIPSIGNLADPHLGSYRSRECVQCNIPKCGGHYGIIYFCENFVKEREKKINENQTLDNKSILIINPMYIKTVVYILNSVCTNCSSLLASKETINQKVSSSLEGEARVKQISDIFNKSVCKNCNHLNTLEFESKVSEQKGLIHYKVDKEKSKKKTIDVYNILTKMKDEDVKLLNLGPGVHPRDFIMRAILVTPPSSRPPRFSGDKEEQDTFTKAYANIIKTLNDYRSKHIDFTVCEERVINQVRGLYKVKSDTNGHGVAASTFHKIVNGKKGIFRFAVQTGRTGNAARAVLGSAPDIEFGYVTVPRKVVNILTIPEYVTVWNIKALEKLANEGKIENITPVGKTERFVYRGQSLRVGDQVFRHLQNGDMVVFSRQPVIHRPSIMGYRAIISDGDNIRLHMGVTTPHNADFDGDDGNILAMVDFLAKTDARYVMNVSQCVISSQDSKPIMGIVFDGLTSAFLMTSESKPLSSETFNACTLLMTNRLSLRTLLERCIRYKVHPLSGKALFSALLPEDFYYNKGDVRVIDGVLISGVITKEHVGASENSIIQVISKRYGSARRDQFITDANFVLNHYLAARGFTVSIEDCLPGYQEEFKKTRDPGQAVTEVLRKINEPIQRQLKESQTSIKKAVDDLKNPLLAAEAEGRIAKIANDLTAKGLSLVRDKIVGPKQRLEDMMAKLQGYIIPNVSVSQEERNKINTYLVEIESLLTELSREMNIEDDFDTETEILETFVTAWSKLFTLDDETYRLKYSELLRELLNKPITPFEYDRVVNELDTLARCSLDMLKEKIEADTILIKEKNDEIRLRKNVFSLKRFNGEKKGLIEKYMKEIKEGKLEQLRELLKEVRPLLSLFSASENHLANMAGKIGAGAKGDMSSIAKIASSIGQQYFGGERIFKGKKCFPSVDLGDPDIRTQGYISKNFLQGINPTEFFALMVGGRQGLIDTAAKTSMSGDLHHRVNRDLENLVLDQDYRVTNDLGVIISSCYGGDAFEASELVKINDDGHQYYSFADPLGMAESLNAKYGWISADIEQAEFKVEKEFNIQEYMETKEKPRITKFEKSAAIAERAKQLAGGALPLVNVDTTKLNEIIDVAEAELDEGRLPIHVVRDYPDGTSKKIYLGYNL